MMQPAPIHRPGVARLAILVALLVVVRVLGWELHLVVEQHEVGEACEVCLIAERGGNAVAASAASALPPRPSDTPQVPRAEILRTVFAPCPLPRGPPSFHG